jgi:ketosteroid isomerase-like protein
MVTRERALKFAQEWIEAWNARDLEGVLSHYADDFEMSSPFIAAFTGEPSGTLKGKARVSEYWQDALKRIPDLRFELLEVFTCVDSITIYYKAVLGKLATEVFFLNQDGKAYRALAHYDS